MLTSTLRLLTARATAASACTDVPHASSEARR